MKKIVSGIICVVVICLGIFCVFTSKTDVYAFIDEQKEVDGVITFRVFGSGNYKCAGYDLKEHEKGTYEFVLHGRMIFGELYPITIEINNKDHHIKKIIQKEIESDGFEIIYDSSEH